MRNRSNVFATASVSLLSSTFRVPKRLVDAAQLFVRLLPVLCESG